MINPLTVISRTLVKLSEKQKFLLVLGGALLVRLLLIPMTLMIAEDGIQFIELAKAVLAGRGDDFILHGQHPLYPLLIAATHFVVPRWDIAGQLVSAVLGGLMVVPLYYMLRNAITESVALLTILLVAAHPQLCRVSGDVLSESTYIFFVVSAVALGWFALQKGRVRLYALVGVATGLAYLTRPEGGAILILLVAWTLLQRIRSLPRELRKRLVVVVVMVVCFVVVTMPYVFFLRSVTGEWMLTPKKSISRVLTFGRWGKHTETQKMMEKMTESRKPADNEVEKVSRRFEPPPPVIRRSGDRESVLIAFLKAFWLYPLLLCIFIRRVTPYRWKAELYLLTAALMYGLIVVAFSYYAKYVETRHLLPIVPLALFWVAIALYEIPVWFLLFVRWVARHIFRSKWAVPFSWLRPLTIICVLLVLVAILPKSIKTTRSSRRGDKEIGYWIREKYGPDKIVMTSAGLIRIPFYADGIHRRMNARDYDGIIAELNNDVELLVVSNKRFPELADFLERASQENDLELVRRVPRSGSDGRNPNVELIVYEVVSP